MTASHYRPRKGLGHWGQVLGTHAALLIYTAFALFPVLLVVLNSFKSRRAIFRNLYVYAGPEHPHAAQQPKEINFTSK